MGNQECLMSHLLALIQVSSISTEVELAADCVLLTFFTARTYAVGTNSMCTRMTNN